MNKSNIKEIVYFFVCVAFLVGIAFYTGFFNNLNFNSITFLPESSQSDSGKQILNTFNTRQNPNVRRIVTNSKYNPEYIPKQIYDAVVMSGNWREIFSSSRKIIFYVYSSDNSGGFFDEEFNRSIMSYLSDSNNYTLVAYEKGSFNSSKNANSPTKIANSMKEFNDQRTQADLYSRLAYFMESCGKSFCIINNKSGEYIKMRHPSATEAQTVLSQYRTW